MLTFREIAESIQKLSDEKMDDKIKNYKEGVITFPYNSAAVTELGRILDNVLVTKDKKFFHIKADLNSNEKRSLSIITKKYNLKEIK